ncbi:MAG: hypothetical protein Q8Q33_01535, partial [Chlamydiota bacterium]|nr:hypothetical protein [Chlamydiota bacterium]
HPFINAVYEGKSISFLNKMMESRNVLPLKFYDDEAAMIFHRFIKVDLCILMILAAFTITRNGFKWIAKLILCFVASLVLLEGLLSLMLIFPKLAKIGPFPLVQKIYFEEYRNYIQYEPDCAQYDPEITYTLKPGSCTFSNTEYNNKYFINHLGLRDDEGSTLKPQIILLGDSYAMGWGVDQNKTYAHVLEELSGLKVLNAGVASYATVREMRMLDRLDTSNCRTLIIHYCENDYKENNAYFSHDNTLGIMDEETYQQVIKDYQKKKQYFPGKYVFAAYRSLRKNEHKNYIPDFRRHELHKDRDYEAKIFLNALCNASHVDISRMNIIVLADETFDQSLNHIIGDYGDPAFVKNIKTVNLTEIIKPDHNFILDDHINAKGHRAIAESILKMIDTTSS